MVNCKIYLGSETFGRLSSKWDYLIWNSLVTHILGEEDILQVITLRNGWGGCLLLQIGNHYILIIRSDTLFFFPSDQCLILLDTCGIPFIMNKPKWQRFEKW